MLKNLEVQKFNFKKIYKNQKIIVILFIIGVILLIVPSFFKHKKNKIIETSGNQEFVEKIQNDIADMVSNIEGAGKSKVLITLDEGEEIIYLAEKKENSQVITDENSYNQNLKRKTDDIEKKYITTKDSNGNETPVIIKKIEPKIRGAVISCQGAKNPEVRENIIKMVSVALDINSSKICVTKFRK